MDKMDEQVLVFPACYQKHLVGLPGFVSSLDEPGNVNAYYREIVPQMRFMRRGDVEDDPSINQVIPYVVVRSFDNTVLLYNRGDKGTETRLAGEYSIGIGGHINPIDEEEANWAQNQELVFNAAAREINEELQWKVRSTDLVVRGFLYLTNKEVDAVHFGVVMEIECEQPLLIRPTIEATHIRWVQPEELKNYELENWSAIVRDKLLLGEK